MCNVMFYLDLTFELATVTLSLKILLGYIWATVRCRKGHWFGGVGVQHHGLTMI